jgi:predicted nucleotidyltransferase
MRRTTINFDAEVYEALRLRAAEVKTSISEYVNDAVSNALDEDAEDLAVIEERRNEPNVDFEEFVADMKRRGRL